MGLRLSDVTVRFGGVTAVDGVSLDIPTGEVFALLGASGSGKSTLLRAIAGLEPCTGEIEFDGVDVTRLPVHQRGFALMFQDGQLFPHLDVAGNVGYALRVGGVVSTRFATRAAVSERVAELLGLVGLGGFGDRRVTDLSGGEQQRVALARSLAAEPRLLLLDEPLSSLDRELRERLAVELREILTAAGTTAILVTHDHAEAAVIADRTGMLEKGRLVRIGSTPDRGVEP